MHSIRQTIGLSLVGAIVLLAACSKAGEVPETAGNQKERTPPKPEPIELVFQDADFGWTKEKFMEKYGDAIAKKFPHITVTYRPLAKAQGGATISETVLAGEQLDIILSPLGAFNNKLRPYNVQYDIMPLIKKYKYDLDRLDPAVVALSKQIAGGGIFDIPVAMTPAALVYNKDLFDKFGVAYPKDGLSWDEVYELAKKLTRNDNGVQYYGLLASVGHYNSRNQLSLNLVNPATHKVDFESDQWKSYLENLVRFYQIPGFKLDAKQLTIANFNKMWLSDRTVAMFLPISNDHIFEGMNYDFATYPIFKEYPGVGPQAYPFSFYNSAP